MKCPYCAADMERIGSFGPFMRRRLGWLCVRAGDAWHNEETGERGFYRCGVTATS